MKIAIAGYRGFIGSNIVNQFKAHEIIQLKRADLYSRTEDLAEKIREADVVINVSGYSISKRWNRKNREKIEDSRVKVNANLLAAMNALQQAPAYYFMASAIGIYEYGEEHTEESEKLGTGFPALVVKNAEAATKNVPGDTKLVILRLGLVLGMDGGAFPSLVKTFRFYTGSIMGSGKQVYSFVHISDVVRAVDFILEKKLRGTFNITSPEPVSNRTFSKALARALGRPLYFRVPAIMLRILMGSSSELITKGHAVYPENLLKAGFKFNFVRIEDAINNLLNKE